MKTLIKLLALVFIALGSICFGQTAPAPTKSVTISDIRLSQIMGEAELHFRNAEANAPTGNRALVRVDLDKALDVILNSGENAFSDPRLNNYYLDLVQRSSRVGTEVAKAALQNSFAPPPPNQLASDPVIISESTATTPALSEPTDESATTTIPPPASTPDPVNTGGTVNVRGYYRKDGTYVRPHTRRAPRH